MDIVKKNLLSIICGVVALIAIILLFWPTGGYQQTLQSRLDSRKQVYQNLNQLLNRSRNLPIVTPGQAESTPLRRFPSRPIIDAGKTAQQAVQHQANQMLQDAVAMNKHALLVPDSLPSPRATEQYRFTQEYMRRLNLRHEADNSDSLQAQVLKGTEPLTQDQVKAAADQLWQTKFQPRIQSYQGQSNETNLKAQFDRESAQLPEKLMAEAARTHQIYVEPGAFDFDPTVQKAALQGQPSSPADIWYAQVGLWVESDIAKAIADTNAQSQNILESPVKRLIKITLPRVDQGFYTMQAGPQRNANNAAVPPPPVSPDTVVAAASPTGRVSNTLYDVVHFELSVDLEANAIPIFLANLTQNQFIYVNQLNLTKVDSVLMQHQGYLYGEKPMARLDIHCEMLFLRGWTVPLMPDQVKHRLGVQPTQVAGL